MSILKAVESSTLVDWFLTSFWGFPVFIAFHSVGMAFVVGLSIVVALRYVGFLQEISKELIDKLIGIAWVGFIINAITGFSLLLSRVSQYLFDPTFLIKIAFIVVAAMGLRRMQIIFRHSFDTNHLRHRYLPAITVFSWIAALTAGRWIAYLSGIYS